MRCCLLCGLEVDRLAIMGVLAVFCMTQTAVALSLSGRVPVVDISVNARKIKLDSATSVGMYKSETALDVRLTANCPHQVGVSFKGFANRRGVRIRREDVSVFVNGVRVSSRLVPVVASSQATPPSGLNVPIGLGFAVRNLQAYPAGSYHGVVALQVMATP
jgi:hypothetical protein